MINPRIYIVIATFLPEIGGAEKQAFAQALKQLNDLARQRLPEAGSGTTGQLSGELSSETDIVGDEEDALEKTPEKVVHRDLGAALGEEERVGRSDHADAE